MTKTVGGFQGLEPLARLLKGQRQTIIALSRHQNQYIIDPTTGNAVAIFGDISHAPVNTSPPDNYTGTPTVVSTGLSGFGVAIYVNAEGDPEPTWASGGSWVQLPTSGFDDPMTTIGDLIVGGTSGTPEALHASTGAAADVLTLETVSGHIVPVWTPPPGSPGAVGFVSVSLADQLTLTNSYATVLTLTIPIGGTYSVSAHTTALCNKADTVRIQVIAGTATISGNPLRASCSWYGSAENGEVACGITYPMVVTSPGTILLQALDTTSGGDAILYGENSVPSTGEYTTLSAIGPIGIISGGSFPPGETTGTVPAGATFAIVTAEGAAGYGTYGGPGSYVQATVPVTGGAPYRVTVGAMATSVRASSGASDMRLGGSGLADRVIVAAAGGSQGTNANGTYGVGGTGGGFPTGAYPEAGSDGDPPPYYTQSTGGSPATASAGGARGTGVAGEGTDGSLGTGGTGGPPATEVYPGGGGGDGYYGGGGGASSPNVLGIGAGGGGGTDYVEGTATDITDTPGHNAGAGFLSIVWVF